MSIYLIGDSCVDKYIYGDAGRINPEAPTPVFVPVNEVVTFGMSYNVLESIKKTGNECVLFHGINERKTRFVDKKSNYILIRVDEKISFDVFEINKFLNSYKKGIILISDYDKGYLSESHIQKVSTLDCNFSIMDTKKRLGDWSRLIDYVKINEKEFLSNGGEECVKFVKKAVIVTRGGDGFSIYWKDKEPSHFQASTKVEVRDVVGAGDVFLAVLSVCMAQGYNLAVSCEIACSCASESVTHKGTSVVSEKHFNNIKKLYENSK